MPRLFRQLILPEKNNQESSTHIQEQNIFLAKNFSINKTEYLFLTYFALKTKIKNF